jgi:hypothetical protein
VGTRVFNNDTQENHTCIERMAATHTLHMGFVKSTTRVILYESRVLVYESCVLVYESCVLVYAWDCFSIDYSVKICNTFYES